MEDKIERLNFLIDLVIKTPKRTFFVYSLNKKEIDFLSQNPKILKIEEAENSGIVLANGYTYCKIYVEKKKRKEEKYLDNIHKYQLHKDNEIDIEK